MSDFTLIGTYSIFRASYLVFALGKFPEMIIDRPGMAIIGQLKEVPRRLDRPALAESRSWIWLAKAAVLLMFSNGANNIPLADWLAPVFVMRFVRSRIIGTSLPSFLSASSQRFWEIVVRVAIGACCRSSG